jgi:hypothetical protein
VPGEFRGDLSKSFRALSQDLKSMPIGLPYHIENPAYEVQRHVGMEKVAHRIDEDLPRLIPPQGLIEYVGL